MSKSKLAGDCPPNTRTHLGRTWQRTYQPIGAEPSRTAQEFKEECDINRIMRRYQHTGALTHFAKYAPIYGEISSCDLQEAENLLIRARQLFADLPSSLRDRFHTPEAFLDFVQDANNRDEMIALGLTESPEPVVPPPPSIPAA